MWHLFFANVVVKHFMYLDLKISVKDGRFRFGVILGPGENPDLMSSHLEQTKLLENRKRTYGRGVEGGLWLGLGFGLGWLLLYVPGT